MPFFIACAEVHNTMTMVNSFLAVGDRRNWESAFSKGNIWGATEKRKEVWKKLMPGDLVFFYVKAPVRGVVGYGKMTTKFYDASPFFARDLRKDSEWPWRFKFEVLWPDTKDLLGPGPKVRIKDLNIEPRGSFHKLSIHNSQGLLRRCGQGE